MNQLRPDRTATQWGRFDQAFTSTVQYLNPVQEAQFAVTFTSPTGAAHTVDGFWDGANTWRIRFMPDTEGAWSFVTHCSDPANPGLHERSGAFWCAPADPSTRFGQHGSIRVAPNRRYFEHTDGTPFFWLADTCWSGPLQSSAEEWEDYLRTASGSSSTPSSGWGCSSSLHPTATATGRWPSPVTSRPQSTPPFSAVWTPGSMPSIAPGCWPYQRCSGLPTGPHRL